MDNKKIMIGVVATLVISIIGLGIAFAAFSRNLTIGGNASVVASTWDIVFEGVTNTNTIDDPVLTGTANEVVHPTIGSNGTSIGNYSVTLTTPGDSVTYNFKVHNKGDYAGDVSSIVMNSGVNLTTDTSKQSSEANTLNTMDYKLYYTDNNELVGQSAKDCLEPGESENVTLRIVFSSTDATNINVLPSSDLLLDNLGVTVNYTQTENGTCASEQSSTPSGNAFQNIDGAYYTYEGKSFIGTGLNNVIISETIISEEIYSHEDGIENGDGTYTYTDTPAADAARAYCSGCRLMTYEEALAWDTEASHTSSEKRTAKYNGVEDYWLLADAEWGSSLWVVDYAGCLDSDYSVSSPYGVRPAVSISNNATMSGSGTSGSPYVITVSQ